MRILHTVSDYFPGGGGGAAEVVRQVSERLAARGHEVTVVSNLSGQGAARSEKMNGVEIRRFRIISPLRQAILGIYGETEDYKKYLLSERRDIIMNYAAQTWHSDLTYGLLGHLSCASVLCACGYSGLLGWRRPLYAHYFRKLPHYLRKYTRVVYHSGSYQDKLFGDANHITNYSVIPNGVDEPFFDRCTFDFRTHYGIKTKYMVVAVGDHFKNKGHRRVIDSVSALGRSDLTLVIIGRNVASRPRSCSADCRQAAVASDGRIRLINTAPREHVIGAFRSADIMLSGSAIEVFPLVILEAMVSRVPYIAFPAGNISELPGGIVVHSTAEMGRLVSSLLNDVERRQELGAAGRAAVLRQYTWERVIDQYESVYGECCTQFRKTLSRCCGEAKNQ